jgi:hypothetical protein
MRHDDTRKKETMFTLEMRFCPVPAFVSTLYCLFFMVYSRIKYPTLKYKEKLEKNIKIILICNLKKILYIYGYVLHIDRFYR